VGEPSSSTSLASICSQHASKYKRDAHLAKAALDALEGLAIDNFVDAHKLSAGRDVTGKIGGLKSLIGNSCGGRYALAGGAEEAVVFMESPL